MCMCMLLMLWQLTNMAWNANSTIQQTAQSWTYLTTCTLATAHGIHHTLTTTTKFANTCRVDCRKVEQTTKTK